MPRTPGRYSTTLPLLVLLLLIGLASLPDVTGHLLDLLRPTANAANNFTVNSIGDGADSNLMDGVCNDGAGSCTLRAAIEQANSVGGSNIINFSIGSGVKTIVPTTDLPIISGQLVIDGTTQPGFAGTPIIEINGNNRPNTNRAGLLITACCSTIKGLVINRVNNAAIAITTNGSTHIEGNFIGTDVTGSLSLGNSVGVIVNTAFNKVGGATAAARNVISGNFGAGIELNVAEANSNAIEGNYIGVNAAGTAALGNSSEGIRVTGSSNRIGDTAPGSGNVISGNGGSGIQIGGQMTTVLGNFIGTNAAGTAAIGNGDRGIRIFNSPGNLVGGQSIAARNVISGNFGAGISIEESGAFGNVVQGNFIGTDVTGVVPLPNSPEGFGVGNSSGGVFINRGSSNAIGGAEMGAANTIAFNGGAGIWVLAGDANRISHNLIFGNLGLGIDLGPAGVTPNDVRDTDTGANALQNFPVITSVNTVGGRTTVTGTFGSADQTSYGLEFFANHGCHPSGNGEGARYLGTDTTRTDANGNAIFQTQFQSTLPVGQVVTVTATKGSPPYNTSEFSPCNPNGATGLVQFGATTMSVREDLNALTIPVNRVGGSSGTVTVNYATANHTAIAGQDYTPISGTLTFADGETSKTISLPIINDMVAEQSETVFVTLSSPEAPDVVGASGIVVVRIFDPSNATILSFNGAGVNEGNAGTTNALGTVSLNIAIGQTVTVNYQTLAMTATSGVDFQPVSGSLTFPPGVTTQTVSVPIIGDTLDEPDETLTLQLSNAVNAAISVSSNPSVVLILDDDPAPAISVNDVTVIEGTAGTTDAVFTLSLSSVSGRQVNVNFATANGTATAGADYQSATGTVTFNPGETSKPITVVVNGDVLNESNETFFVNLSNANNATLADSQGQGTIINGAPSGGVIRFSAANYSVAEGAGSKTITVERIGDTSQPVTVDYASSDHSNPADFIPCTAAGAGFASSRCDFTTTIGTLRFAAGETSKTFDVLISQDNYVEGTETLEQTLSNLTGGAVFGVPSTAILSITDDATEGTTNPIDMSSEFVRSQYHDILHREPDPAGLAFWTDNIEKCNDPARRPAGQTVAQCIDKQRESTAIAFFMSPEFQMTGGFVYRLYKGSLTGTPNYDGGSSGLLGRFPTFLEFMSDVSKVSEGILVNNQISGAVVEANRNRLAAEFVLRPEFVAKYAGLNDTLYVQELFNTTGIAATAAQKQALMDGLGNGTETRASVLRKVVDGTVVISESNVQFTTPYGQAFFNQELRRVFVYMEYVGYLRRNPDTAGFNHWLGKLNQYNGDPFQAEMVRSFILSPEYRSRFGTP